MKKNQAFKRLTSRRFLRIIQAVVSLLLIFSVYRLNMLPMLYFMIFVAIVLLLFLLPFYMMRKKKQKNKGGSRIAIGKIISIVLSILLLIMNIMVFKGNSFLNSIGSNFETHVVSVIVLADSNIESLDSLKSENFGITTIGGGGVIANAIDTIEDEVEGEINTKAYKSNAELANALYEGKVSSIILNESTRYLILQEMSDFTSKTKVIYKTEIKEKIGNTDSKTDITEETINIYISGADVFEGQVEEVKHGDVNIILTVNPKTKQILMTTIPRDTYVELASFKEMDKLTHASIYGMNESINTLNNFLDCKIDYYVRINFTSLMKVVDAVGGVTVDNPVEFTNGYESSSGYGFHHFAEGPIELDGKKALIYSRERKIFADGDNMRGQNQQRVLKALIHKASSPAIITRYSKILDSISGAFETNLEESQIRSFIQMQLSDMATWDIQNEILLVEPSESTESYSMKGSSIYVSIPDEDSLKKIQKNIKLMEDGKKVNLIKDNQ
ncbi:LCP family protein [Amedibacillus sp. YH-ame6]